MNELSNLQEKLNKLLTRHAELKKLSAEMNQTIPSQEKEIKKLKQENARLKEKIESLSTNKWNDLADNQKDLLKTRIDAVLNMIEKSMEILK